jgi:hypothetical protein
MLDRRETRWYHGPSVLATVGFFCLRGQQVNKRLRAAGLKRVKLFGGWDMSDYHCRDSRRLLILAQKEG